MNSDELEALFDQQATKYDQQWEKMTPMSDMLYFFLKIFFSALPPEASVLCVGAGTGKELLFLAREFPRWRFTVVEPSGAMLQVCRSSLEDAGHTSRCDFHHGYVHSLSPKRKHDAATCFLVSQFILDPEKRSLFFREIAGRLKPGGILASSDLSADTSSENYQDTLALWLKVVAQASLADGDMEKIKETYAKDIAILPAGSIVSIIESGGFETPVRFYQAGMIQAFLSRARLR